MNNEKLEVMMVGSHSTIIAKEVVTTFCKRGRLSYRSLYVESSLLRVTLYLFDIAFPKQFTKSKRGIARIIISIGDIPSWMTLK